MKRETEAVMQSIADAKVRRLEADLAKEKQLRLSLAQRLGGVNSLNARLTRALAASRAEVSKRESAA
jgi:hypothetical protein